MSNGKSCIESIEMAAWAFAAVSNCISPQTEKLGSVMLCKADGCSNVFDFVSQ